MAYHDAHRSSTKIEAAARCLTLRSSSGFSSCFQHVPLIRPLVRPLVRIDAPSLSLELHQSRHSCLHLCRRRLHNQSDDHPHDVSRIIVLARGSLQALGCGTDSQKYWNIGTGFRRDTLPDTPPAMPRVAPPADCSLRSETYGTRTSVRSSTHRDRLRAMRSCPRRRDRVLCRSACSATHCTVSAAGPFGFIFRSTIRS